jgi:hypothetical protein
MFDAEVAFAHVKLPALKGKKQRSEQGKGIHGWYKPVVGRD